MARILVFATDWTPTADECASDGGLRALQLIEALQRHGHEVASAAPRLSLTVQAIRLAPARLRGTELYETAGDQIALIRRIGPDAIIWLSPAIRQVPFSGLGDIVHVCDLSLADAAQPDARATGNAGLAASCRGADVLLTGSPEQHGYLLGRLHDPAWAPPVVLAGYATPPKLRRPVATDAAALTRLHWRAADDPDVADAQGACTNLLLRCAAWADRRGGLRMIASGQADPGRTPSLTGVRALAELAALGAVEARPDAAVGAILDGYGPGSLALDCSGPCVARQFSLPVWLIDALSHGVPVLSTVDSPAMRRAERAGAAVIVPAPEALEQALDRLAELPAADFAAMSAASHRFAAQEFGFDAAAQAIDAAISSARARRRNRTQQWTAGTQAAPQVGHVLVLSSEQTSLRDLRVDLPFGVLYRRRLIAGYSVWDRDRISASTVSDDADTLFGAIWVQRSVSAELALVLDGLGLPFVYDIDDNLLVSPSYRPPFTPENLQAARNFVRRATVLSCSTARLATLLRTHAAADVAHRTVVTQNLLRTAPSARPAGPPGCLIWASSDVPALTEGRLQVFKAVRDFCLTHRLRLVCIGAPPPDLILESDVEVEHLRMLGYAAYLELLRSLAPAIMVCPLETSADPATQDFVDGKSDIKMLEVLATGLVGVFSAARAYLDSDLPAPILCENTYAGWFDGLARAHRACTETTPAPILPGTRLAGALGCEPFHEALLRVRLRQPIRIRAITDQLRLIRARLARRLLSFEEFDDVFYLAKYPDVRFALEGGKLDSAYQHYVHTGFAEHRMARPDDAAVGRGEQWWASLMHTMLDLRTGVENRAPRIEELKTRRAMRLRLRHEDRRT